MKATALGAGLGVLVAISGALAGGALAGSLSSSVERESFLPRAVVADASSGATGLERYRSREKQPLRASSDDELVLVVRVPALNSPDTVKVVKARRSKRRIGVELEVRRFTGALAANDVTDGYVTVELGKLPRGRYKISVGESILEFADLSAPDKTSKPKQGMQSTIEFSVR